MACHQNGRSEKLMACHQNGRSEKLQHTTTVIDQVHLTEAGLILAPVSPSPNWDLVLEQRTRLGETRGLFELGPPTD